MSQTSAQVRVIDPILTTHAQGYVRPGNVGQFLFPFANVNAYGGQILTFGKESFRRYNTKRAPGSATQRVQFGYAGKPYAIQPAALEALVPFEHMNDAAQVPGIDLGTDSVDMVLDVFALEHECECADLARNVSNYDSDHKVTLTSTDKWTHKDSDPSKHVEVGIEAVRGSIGMRPNIALVSAKAFSALKSNPAILDRLRYTGRDSLTTALLAALWGIQSVQVGEAVVADGQAADFGDVWGTDVVLAYVAPPSGGNRRSNARPSYGYTYSITGMPAVEQPYQDRNRKSWVYGVSADRTPVLSGISAGYLIKDAGAA